MQQQLPNAKKTNNFKNDETSSKTLKTPTQHQQSQATPQNTKQASGACVLKGGGNTTVKQLLVPTEVTL